ncbi:MAG: HAD family hydrolase [Planctomycetota bacterium]|jgi:FMN phosphatase YigB (HAD superfamily)|nr:HAD family hydrolase [Planctomycetota bacterium]
MPIRTITFDWGDTLATNHGQPYGYQHRRALGVLAQALTACGGAPGADWLERCHDELHAAWTESVDPVQNPEHREFDMATMIADWARAAGADPDSPCVAAALTELADSCIGLVLAYDGVEAVLSELKQRGYRIGILSHVAWPGDCCRRWFATRGWDRLFDFYSFSSDVGWIKPNQRHYDHACAEAGCGPDQILHVGDHPERDITAAAAYGFQTCLRMTEGIYAGERITACKPDYTVVHIREMLEFLR